MEAIGPFFEYSLRNAENCQIFDCSRHSRTDPVWEGGSIPVADLEPWQHESAFNLPKKNRRLNNPDRCGGRSNSFHHLRHCGSHINERISSPENLNQGAR